MSPSRSTYRHLDWILIGCYILLAAFGWLNIYASTYSEEAAGIFSLASRSGNQLVWIGVAAVAAVLVLFLSTRFYKTIAWPLYILSLVLLAAVLVFGHEVNGSKSWLSLPGGFAVQPSEFSKTATALCLSRVMGSYGFKLSRTADFFKVAAILIVPVGLIALEPDVGTILVYCSLAFMLYREGLPGKFLGYVGFAILLFLVTLKFSPSVSILTAIGAVGLLRTLASRMPVRTFLIYAAFITAASFLPRLLETEFVSGFNRLDAEYWLLILTAPFLVWFIIYNVRNKIRGWTMYVIPFVASLVLIFSVDFIFHNVLKPHHRDRIENLLGISVYYQTHGIFRAYSPLVAVEKLFFADFGGSGFMLHHGRTVSIDNMRERMCPAFVTYKKTVALGVVSGVLRLRLYSDQTAVAVLAAACRNSLADNAASGIPAYMDHLCTGIGLLHIVRNGYGIKFG